MMRTRHQQRGFLAVATLVMIVFIRIPRGNRCVHVTHRIH